jgi:Protein of unknown function (DUF3618)
MSGAQERLPAVPADVQRLRAEIERTREHLGATVDQLAARADVKGRARAKATGLARQARGRVAGVTRDHPVPLAAAAAGVLAAAVSLAIWQRRRR